MTMPFSPEIKAYRSVMHVDKSSPLTFEAHAAVPRNAIELADVDLSSYRAA